MATIMAQNGLRIFVDDMAIASKGIAGALASDQNRNLFKSDPRTGKPLVDPSLAINAEKFSGLPAEKASAVILARARKREEEADKAFALNQRTLKTEGEMMVDGDLPTPDEDNLDDI